MTIKLPAWVWAATAVAALASLGNLAMRHRAESQNRAVGLALEIGAVRDAAAASGRSIPETLADLKSHGLVGVALTEETVDDLVRGGNATLTQNERGTYVGGSAANLYRVQRFLTARTGKPRSPSPELDLLFAQGLDGQQIRLLPIGINPTDAKAVVAAGLEVIARHQNIGGVNEAAIRSTLAFDKMLGVRYFLPAGDEVLGFRDLTKATEDEIKQDGIAYVAPEFVKIAGDTEMTLDMPEDVVRLHSAQQGEIDKMSMPGIEERYTKAFRERNIRWLLLRPSTLASSNGLASLDDMLAHVGNSVTKAKGSLRPPRPFAAPKEIRLLYPVAGLAMAAAFIGLLLGYRMPKPVVFGLGGLALLLGAAAYLPGARSYVGLMGAVTFPLLAYSWFFSLEKNNLWRDYVLISLISLVGGLCVAGQLVGLKWMVQAVQFSGIKLAHFGPILVIAGILMLRQGGLKELSKRPILWGTLVTGLAVSGAVLFMLSRTGNDNPAGVSNTELAFRSILDAVFYARPRTKEFLIGHPALLIGIMLWVAARTRPGLMPAAAVALVISSIGQTSVVNTLCHAHTPVFLSLARIGIGHVVGSIIGAALGFLLGRFLPTPTRAIDSE